MPAWDEIINTIGTRNYTYTATGTNWHTTPISYDYSSILTHADLEKIEHNLYKIITEHIALDISEDDFIKLLEN